MERIYFSKQNFSIIYNILRKKIMNSSNYDISSTESFHKELVNVMKSIYAQKNSQRFNIPSNLSEMDQSRYLSQKCINIALPYFEDTIKKTSDVSSTQTNNTTQMNQLERDMSTGMNSQINRLSERPMVNTRLDNNGPSVNSQYDQLMKARQPIQQNMPNPVNFQADKNQESNDDVQKRYSQLTQMRQNEYVQQPQSQPQSQNTNTFQHPSTNINQQFQSGNAAEMNNNISMVIRDKNRDGFQQPAKQFNSFPQNNPNDIGSNLNDNPFASNNIPQQSNSLEAQFKNITNSSQTINTNVQPDMTSDLNMVPDNVDYDELMKQFQMPNPISSDTPEEYDGVNSMNDQFQTSIVNSQKIKDENVVPDSQVVDSDLKALEKVPKVNTIDNTEFKLLKEILQNQQVNLDDTNRRINDLVNIIEKQDLSTFYDTVINMPSLIAKQSEEQFALRTHNLVISSRDRDLTNESFNKYNFRVEFGVEGGQTISADRRPRQTSRVLTTGIRDISTNPSIFPISAAGASNGTYIEELPGSNLSTSGSGTGLKIKITVNGTPQITSIEIIEKGSNFKIGDTITIASGSLGGLTADLVLDPLADDDFEPISTNAITNVPRTFVSPGAANPNLVDVLKNVVEIKIKRVIIPRPRDAVFYPDPYYFVCIEEFDSNVLTTKRLSDKVFCKIHFDKEVVFGGIGNSAISANSEGTGMAGSSGDHEDDNGRKYLYYKNDDGDKKVFYNAPLASLDRLTIKILDSRGRVLGDVWGDKDTSLVASGGGASNGDVTTEFYNNTFIKDELLNTDNNNTGRVINISSGASLTTSESGTSDVAPPGKLVVNLTNQIEYVFEVTTKEKDLDGIFKAENL